MMLNGGRQEKVNGDGEKIDTENLSQNRPVLLRSELIVSPNVTSVHNQKTCSIIPPIFRIFAGL